MNYLIHDLFRNCLNWLTRSKTYYVIYRDLYFVMFGYLNMEDVIYHVIIGEEYRLIEMHTIDE